MRNTPRATAGLVAALLLAVPAAAADYGDVRVTVESEPKGRSDHGYAEVWVRVTNRSTAAPHAVAVRFPKSSYSSGVDHVRAVTRGVTVDPGQSAVVPLAYPERLVFQGSGVGVSVDGRDQEDAVPVSVSGRGYSGYSSYGSAPTDHPLVLYSLAVDPRFPDWVRAARDKRYPGSPPPGGGWSGGTPAVTTMSADTGCVRADRPAADWSPNWLGYSRYDGVVVTAADLRAMPAPVRAAVGQYVECGGTLLVLGPDPQLPGAWGPLPAAGDGLPYRSAGFGRYGGTTATDLSRWDPAALFPLLDAWSAAAGPWKSTRSVGEANRRFPVVDDVGVPTTGLLALMLVFVVVIGPVNLYLLGRARRKLWLFWTVPLASALTCLAVFAYTALAEGWTGKARVEGFTVLDETTRRAASVGWAGVYSPLSPRDGLHFSADAEVTYQNGEDPSSSYSYRRRDSAASALTLDWTADQHLAAGWVTPRVPAHFVVRKGEPRRERVTFSAGAGGQPEAVNGLGAGIVDLWYADDAGNTFHAQAVPAGGRATLSPVPKPRPDPGAAAPTPRSLFTSGDWSDLPSRAKTLGPALLTPRTYLAILDAAPFFDEALPGRADRTAKQAVFGLLPAPGKGGTE